ncbi:Helix-turn-helix domain-containing protein [Chryseobacterium arachidis]|uniref:Helix-turn-helix domain-containing protein n=1 Tax=Chryseobacterium arachidis TaxID=1416778 RepID=A0A1M5BR51_9FLAO|nr:helix-turn-helix domain-containing protein [Chryseobacterium arachidis]SHF45014.1 Helix-turn-helix domain-containing protein [Chryseobacterium arachidis]
MKKITQHPVDYDQLMETFVAVFTEILDILKYNQTVDTQYYDSADVKRLLNISDSTLFRIRKSQHIPYIKIGKKIFYPKAFFNNTLKK